MTDAPMGDGPICDGGDFDSDGDGVPDCIDGCPFDPLKTSPGLCGCGSPDVDTDGDGVLDCNDQCPKDPTHTKYGTCGCGVPDNTPLCLVHRYQFNDGTAAAPATTVKDSVGTADGTAVGVTLTGTGTVTLAGTTTDQYIQLPAGIVSAMAPNATFEAWVTWSGTGGDWQRIFDFGTSGVPGMKGTGTSFIFLTPEGGTGVLFVSFINAGNAVNEVPGTAVLTPGAMEHLAVVVDGNLPADAGTPTVSLYLNGVFVASTPATNTIAAITDDNNWLGRSQFLADPSFGGTYQEFRMYSAARSAAQIAADFAAGPDTLPSN